MYSTHNKVCTVLITKYVQSSLQSMSSIHYKVCTVFITRCVQYSLQGVYSIEYKLCTVWFIYSKKLILCHKLWFSNPYIFATICCNDRGIRKFEFFPKTHFLYIKSSILFSKKGGEFERYTVNACTTLVCTLHGSEVTTVEGLGSTQTTLHPVQVE